jgi:hypothetical protein
MVEDEGQSSDFINLVQKLKSPCFLFLGLPDEGF